MSDVGNNDLYGWFDRADQPPDQPTYDPPCDAPCPYCGNPLVEDNVRTHSVMAAEGAMRSYFWRTHRTCDEDAGDGMKQSIFDGVLNRIESDERGVEI